MRFRTLLLAAVAAAVGMPAALAHDFWIEPATFRPAVGEVTSARLWIGHPAAPEAYPRNPAHLAEFAVVGPLPRKAADAEAPGGEAAGALARRALVGRDGADPAGLVRLAAEGRYVLVYRSNPSTVTMEPAAFEAYLREKGQEHVIAARRARGESDAPGTEAFSRCAKALIETAGAEPGATHDVAVGLPLELVRLPQRPIADTATSPAPVAIQLLQHGEPVGRALLYAERLDAGADSLGAAPLPAWTDDQGVARLPLAAGRWMISAVRVERAADDAAQDWRSHWASLTLAIDAPTPAEGSSGKRAPGR